MVPLRFAAREAFALTAAAAIFATSSPLGARLAMFLSTARMNHDSSTSAKSTRTLVTTLTAALIAPTLGACTTTKWSLPTAQEKFAFEAAVITDLEASAQLPFEEEAIYLHLEKFVESHPTVFGSTYALDPAVTGKSLAPYVYRVKGKLTRRDLTLDGYEYAHQRWFTQPVNARAAVWSEPYFDAGGGDIEMVTYSAPVMKDGKCIGVLTADFEVLPQAK